ncbi:hypothetical protein PUN28_010635 [Cardiocondyla obscurior]|uniref:Uncharacterized protein n=1 Tax=Cardiocondyla obscurior TaxID=286306 RepID=A0AAW2FJ29_9HYME
MYSRRSRETRTLVVRLRLLATENAISVLRYITSIFCVRLRSTLFLFFVRTHNRGKEITGYLQHLLLCTRLY